MKKNVLPFEHRLKTPDFFPLLGVIFFRIFPLHWGIGVRRGAGTGPGTVEIFGIFF